jgi:hypothetical protein
MFPHMTRTNITILSFFSFATFSALSLSTATGITAVSPTSFSILSTKTLPASPASYYLQVWFSRVIGWIVDCCDWSDCGLKQSDNPVIFGLD